MMPQKNQKKILKISAQRDPTTGPWPADRIFNAHKLF